MVPLSGGIGSPSFEQGGDFSVFSSEYKDFKGKGAPEYTIGEVKLFTVKFSTPQYKDSPTIEVPLTLAAMTIDMSKPLDSAIGILSGEISLSLVDGDLPVVGTQLAVKGGLEVGLKVSTQLATFGSILKDAGIDIGEDAAVGDVFGALLEAAGTEAAADAFVGALAVGTVAAAIVVAAVIIYQYEKDLADEEAMNAVVGGVVTDLQSFADGFENGWNNPDLQGFIATLNLDSSTGPRQDGVTLGTKARKQAEANLIQKYQSWWNQSASQPDQRQAAVDKAFSQAMAAPSGQAAYSSLLAASKDKYNEKLKHDTFMDFYGAGRGFDQCKEMFTAFWGQPPNTSGAADLQGLPASVVFPQCPKDCYEAMMKKDPTHFPDWHSLSGHPASWD